MDMKMTILSTLRRISTCSLNILTPMYLAIFPVHWLWKREDLSNSEFSRKSAEKDLEEHEYSLYSQNGEDGIIRYLFSQIGVSSKLFLEFGFGFVQNNCLRLILKEGWGGVLIDGSGASIRAFKGSSDSCRTRPRNTKSKERSW